MRDYDGLALVVVNYNTHELLEKNLATISRQLPAVDVVVVDNYSTYLERRAVSGVAESNRWHLVPMPDNAGFGAGIDVGVSSALARGATTVLLLNPDLVIDAESVDALVDRVTTDPLVMVAPVILRPDRSVWSDGNELLLADGSMRSRRSARRGNERYGVVPWLSGACLMLSAELWHRVQGMGRDYFMYWEDVELSYRVASAGGSIHVEEAAVAVHEEGGSQVRNGRGMSDLYYYFNIRNRLLFAARNLGPRTVRRWRRSTLWESRRILLRGGRRQFLQGRGAVTAGWAGMRDGLRLSRPARSGARPVRILLSYPPPGRIRNPYNVMLVDSLRELASLDVNYFSWRGALLGRFDVFHVHWPEATMSSPSRVKAYGKQLAFGLLLLKTRLTRTAWVRTVHNLGLPRDLGVFQTWMLRAEERATTLRIVLSPATRLDPRIPQNLVPHGHYIDWFAGMERADRVPGRIAFVGGIRRYKGVPTLIQSFRELPDESLSLSVSGRLSHAAYELDLRALAEPDARVSLNFDFVPDEELVRLVTQAELVVLPYPEMHNSGMVLCCLSLGTPVLVPDNELNRLLRDEVGHEWLQFFRGELSAEHLGSAMAWVRRTPRAAPDLSRRDWANSARRHAAAYQRALELVRGCSPRRLVVDEFRPKPVARP